MTLPVNSDISSSFSLVIDMAFPASSPAFVASFNLVFKYIIPAARAPRAITAIPPVLASIGSSIGSIINGKAAADAISAPGPPDIPYIIAPMPASMPAPPAPLAILPFRLFGLSGLVLEFAAPILSWV